MRRARHSFLYEVTSSVHIEVEKAVEEARFFEAPLSYCDYLRRFHLFHGRIGAELARVAGDLASRWQIGDRTLWLAEDLASLSLEPIGGAGQASSFPGLAGRDEAWGALYVLQGSTLGARVLRARAERLALPPGAGLAYLSGLAAASSWLPFLDCLEAEPELTCKALARGAIDTFESVRDHLTRSVPQ